VLVISVADFAETERALTTVVPHTTSLRGSKFEVSIPVRFLKPGGFDAQNLTTISQSKLIRRLGALPPAEFERVAQAVRDWLGF
jgi:mRNA interferase MazF